MPREMTLALASNLSTPPIYIKSEISLDTGGIWLIEIIFQTQEDARNLYRHFEKCLASKESAQKILLEEDRHIMKIKIETDNVHILPRLKKGFYEFINTTKRDEWFRAILAQHYYYKDPGEQEQILNIIYDIFEGSRDELASFLEPWEESDLLGAIESVFQEPVSFSFDSFAKFRLKAFFERLERYVDLSIDEYKLEQEYQMFIQTLRDFLAGRQPKLDYLYLLIDEGIVFYDEQYEEIKRGELARMIDRRLLVNHPVYVDSVTIAPLLSIAPRVIYLYTDDPEQPLVRTIHNIFEERVKTDKVKAFHEKKQQSLPKPEENMASKLDFPEASNYNNVHNRCN